MATSEESVVNWEILMNQWRNEPSPRYQLGHHPAFTKSAQDPTIIDSMQRVGLTLIATRPT
jgi:hypothetical protein